MCSWSVKCCIDACGVTYIIITVHWESFAASGAWHKGGILNVGTYDLLNDDANGEHKARLKLGARELL